MRSLFSLLTANDRPKAEGRNEVEWGRKREAKAKKEIERSPAPCQRMKENHPKAHIKGFCENPLCVSNSLFLATIIFLVEVVGDSRASLLLSRMPRDEYTAILLPFGESVE